MIQKCPICEGRGQVPRGFYLDDHDNKSTAPIKCRTCKGSGTLGYPDFAPKEYDLAPVDCVLAPYDKRYSWQ